MKTTNDNIYTKIEAILYRVPQLRVEIENLKLDLEEVEEIIGIFGQSGNVAAGSATNAFNSVVESQVIDRDENLELKKLRIKASIARRERKLKKIENNLSLLTESEMLLIDLRYFKRRTTGAICEILDITKDGFNKRKKKLIVEKLIPLDW